MTNFAKDYADFGTPITSLGGDNGKLTSAASQLLEGDLTITEQGGITHRFGPGDAFFVPRGAVCSRKTEAGVKKIYCMLDPAA